MIFDFGVTKNILDNAINSQQRIGSSMYIYHSMFKFGTLDQYVHVLIYSS